jgi:hypothetical protein
MDITHACDIIAFQWPRNEKKEKERKRKKASKGLVYPNTLSRTYPQIIHHTYLHSRNAIPSIVYVPCLCTQNHTSFYCAIQSSWESSSLRWSSFM